MADDQRVSRIQDAIRDSVKNEQWAQADVLYCELNKAVERDAESIRHHAFAVENSGDPARAATMLRKATRLSPEDTMAILQLGSVCLSQQRHSEAEDAFRRVLEIDPDNVVGIRHLVQCLQNDTAGREEAQELLQHALELDPENAAIWIQLGAIYANDSGRFDEAERAFQRGLELAPESAAGYHNFGQVKRLRGDLEEAKVLLHRANELQPGDTNYAFSLALCYLFMEDLDAAKEWLEKSVQLDPGNNAAQVYIAFTLFLQGNIREGWEQYEFRLKLNEFKSLNYGRPRWEGTDLDGATVLLLREQGMGDNIQFIRYAKLVAEKGGKVVVFAWEQLKELFESVEGVSVVTTGMPEPKNFHRFCPLLSLPFVLGTDEDSIPGNSPYMKAPDDRIEMWREKLSEFSGFRVGLMWRGNPKHVNDRFRSSSLEEVTQLFSVPGTTFFSLMKDRPEHEADLPEGLHDLGSEFSDFADTAAAMEHLDLIISVDTSICHLAGAIGRPVWTMLAKGPDFRWGIEGDTTPWYPTMKLYRQEKLGSWDGVYQRLISDIQERVSNS